MKEKNFLCRVVAGSRRGDSESHLANDLISRSVFPIKSVRREYPNYAINISIHASISCAFDAKGSQASISDAILDV